MHEIINMQTIEDTEEERIRYLLAELRGYVDKKRATVAPTADLPVVVNKPLPTNNFVSMLGMPEHVLQCTPDTSKKESSRSRKISLKHIREDQYDTVDHYPDDHSKRQRNDSHDTSKTYQSEDLEAGELKEKSRHDELSYKYVKSILDESINLLNNKLLEVEKQHGKFGNCFINLMSVYHSENIRDKKTKNKIMKEIETIFDRILGYLCVTIYGSDPFDKVGMGRKTENLIKYIAEPLLKFSITKFAGLLSKTKLDNDIKIETMEIVVSGLTCVINDFINFEKRLHELIIVTPTRDKIYKTEICRRWRAG